MRIIKIETCSNYFESNLLVSCVPDNLCDTMLRLNFLKRYKLNLLEDMHQYQIILMANLIGLHTAFVAQLLVISFKSFTDKKY